MAPPEVSGTPDGCRPDTASVPRSADFADVSADRLAILRIRAERLGPTPTPRPRPANVYLAWISDEEGYVVIGLEH